MLYQTLRELVPYCRGFQRAEAFLEGPQEFFLVAALPALEQTQWVSPEQMLQRYGASLENALEGRPHIAQRENGWILGLPLTLDQKIEGWIFMEGQGDHPFTDEFMERWLPGMALGLQAVFALTSHQSQFEIDYFQQKADLDQLRTMLEIRQKLLATTTIDEAQQTLLDALSARTQFHALLLLRNYPDENQAEVVAVRGWPTWVEAGYRWDWSAELQPFLVPSDPAQPLTFLDILSPAGVRLGSLWIAQPSPNLQEQGTLQGVTQTAGAVFALLEAQEVSRRAELYSQALVRLSSDLELLADPEAIARRALEALLPLSSFDLGGFYKLQDGMGQAVVIVGQVPLQHTLLFDRVPVRLDGPVMQGKEVVLIEDILQVEGATPMYAQAGLRTLLISCINLSGQIYGLLALASLHRVVEVSPEMHSLFSTSARRLERALERVAYLEEINHTRESALKALGTSLELRDLETRGHSDRVVGLSFRLGHKLGFPHLMELRHGAYMHDLGKLAIPDAILFKPGPLDATEYEVVRQHPETAYRMLSTLNFLSEVALNVVRFHHEKWDGSGYPLGLKGEEIPLEARIFAAVDVFDALAYTRPYKAAWTAAQIREELQKIRGKALDPQVVDALLNLIP